MENRITITNKNITEVFQKARKKLEETNIPKNNRKVIMSSLAVWLLHTEGISKYMPEAKYLNKKFSCFNKKGTKYYYKLQDKRTRGTKFLDEKFVQFASDIRSKKIDINMEEIIEELK